MVNKQFSDISVLIVATSLSNHYFFRGVQMKKQRNTVQYFPHDADASSGKTLGILTKKYGNDGYAAWFRLLERLARTENHYITCKNGVMAEWLADDLMVSKDILTPILDLLAEVEAIDSGLWTTHRIIWSQHFVENITEVYRNRRRDTPAKPAPDSDVTTPSLQDNTSELHVDTPQDYGEFKNVRLTDAERDKLIEKYEESGFNERVAELSEGIASKGYKYKNHYATLLAWDRKNKKKERDSTAGKYAHMIRGTNPRLSDREYKPPDQYK